MKEIISSRKAYVMKEENIKNEMLDYTAQHSPYYECESNIKQYGIKEERSIENSNSDCYLPHHSAMDSISCNKYDENELHISTSSQEISYAHLDNQALGNSIIKHKDSLMLISDKHNFVHNAPLETYIQRAENDIVEDVVAYHSSPSRDVNSKPEIYHRSSGLYYKVRSIDPRYAIEEKLGPEIPLNYTIAENLSECSHENIADTPINCSSHEIAISCSVQEAHTASINYSSSGTSVNCTVPITRSNCTVSESNINFADPGTPLSCTGSETSINCTGSTTNINRGSSEPSLHCSSSETPLNCDAPRTPTNCSVPENCVGPDTIPHCSIAKTHVNSGSSDGIVCSITETSLNCTEAENALQIAESENNFNQNESAESTNQSDISIKRGPLCSASDQQESLKLSSTFSNDGAKGMESNFINFLSQFFFQEKDSQNCTETAPQIEAEEEVVPALEEPPPQTVTKSSPRSSKQSKVKAEYQGEVNHKILENYFQCSKCSYAGRTLALLKRHEMSHLENKRFQCSKCSYSTNFNSYLKEHEMTHSNVRPFKCSYCNFASKLKSNIKKHERTHLKDKKISRVRKLQKCSECDFSTTFKTHMEKHQLSHVAYCPYKCFDCDFQTSQKYLLENHRKLHLTGENF